MTTNLRLEAITYDDINHLVSSGYREDQNLDYKEQLPDLDGKKPDDARKKLLIDVAAFANAGGGDILFGVEEGRSNGQPNGIPIALPGIASPNIDALQRRWQSIIESGLDPKMAPKVQLRAISTQGADTPIIVLRIPRSFAAPHMVKESGRFHCRQGPENRTLDTNEIRSAFAHSETWAAYTKRFREERIGRILGDDTPVRLRDSGRLVIHVVPLAAATSGFSVDLHKLKAGNPAPVFYQSSYGPRFNVDGLAIVGDQNGDESHTYTQFFRNGAVECVLTTDADEKTVSPALIERHIVNSLREYLPRLVAAGGDYPFIVVPSLVGMKGRRMPGNLNAQYGTPIPRDVVLLPDLVLERDDVDVPSILRPVFDALWQCVGTERSPSYGSDGVWKAKC